MITCHLRYEIDPGQTAAFEKYATGDPGRHPWGGPTMAATCRTKGPTTSPRLFSFPSLAAYENTAVPSAKTRSPRSS